MLCLVLPVVVAQGVQSFGVADLSTFLTIQAPTLSIISDTPKGYIAEAQTTDGLKIVLEFEKEL